MKINKLINPMKTEAEISDKLMDVNLSINKLKSFEKDGRGTFKQCKMIISTLMAQREILNWILGDNFNLIIKK